MMLRCRYRTAFSLLELLTAVVILGIIAALVMPRVINSGERSKQATCHHCRAEINIAIEQYYLHTGTWPADDLSDISSNINYFPNGIPACPVSGQPYRLDPTTHRVVGHTGNADHSP